MVQYRRLSALFLAATVLSLPLAARAQEPGRHPHYLHALSDLRGARWLLEHRPGDPAVRRHEDIAVNEIDGAIRDLREAAIDDGKDLRDHPPFDMPREYGGRLHRVVELLHNVQGDVDREEDDPAARGLKRRSLRHVEVALQETERAIHDVERDR
jgi:hypothetical protein